MKETKMDDYLGIYESEPVTEEETAKEFSPKKKSKKRMKKLKKKLKKQKKILKMLVKLHEPEMDMEEEGPKPKKEKTFLNKLGEAVIKAVPTVLTTAVTAVFAFVFKRKVNNGSLRFA